MNAGEWYENDSLRVRIVGKRLDGKVITETHGGFLGSISDKSEWKHLPDCDSFYWRPEPVESPEDWVTQDRVPARPGIDQRAYLHAMDSEVDPDGWMDAKEMCWNQMPMHGHRVNGMTIQLRCRRKDLPPLPPETPNREYAYLWSSWKNGRVYMTDISGSFDPKDRELKHDGTGFYLV